MSTSSISNLTDVFVAPERAFQQARVTPKWVLPLIICIVASFLFYSLTSKYKMEDLKARIQANTELSSLEIDRRLSNIESQRTDGLSVRQLFFGFVVIGGLQAIKIFGIAFVLWAVMKIRSREVRYKSWLAVTGLAFLIQIPEFILKLPLIFQKGSMHVSLGPGVFLSKSDYGTPLYRLFDGLDVFSIWIAIVLAIGVYVLTEIPRHKAFLTIAVLWIGWLLIDIYAGQLVQIT